mgnify:CR=1 FL=1
MDKKFVMGIAAMAALTLVSCSSDDLDSFSDNSSKNEAISFDSYLGRSAVAVNGSRGSMLNDKEALQGLEAGFGVFGNYSSTEYTEGTPAAYGNNLFDNQQVTYDKTKSKWTYTPYKYWLSKGHIDFLAYAPYDSQYKNQVSNDNQKLNFTVKSSIEDQKDLLWANAVGQTQDNNPVKFTFNHALSRLGYTVKLKENCSDDVTITLESITLAGADNETTPVFYTSGTIDLSRPNNDANLWSNCVGQQKFDWFSGNYQVKSSTESHPNVNREEDKDYLFVIPQNFKTGTDKLYVIVKYEIKYNDIPGATVTNTVNKELPYNFEQGKAYTINLTIGRPIDFDVNTVITPWDVDNTIPEIPMD